MTPNSSPQNNKTFQNMLTSWGGEDCEAVVDAKSHNVKGEALFRRALSQTPVSQQEEQIMNRAMEIDSHIFLIAGRNSGLGHGLVKISEVAGLGIDKSINVDEALAAIMYFSMSLLEFNRITLRIWQQTSENVKSIYDSVIDGKI